MADSMAVLQRKAAAGDYAAQVALFRRNAESGAIPKREVERLINGCDKVALYALGYECGDMQVILSAGKKNRFSSSHAEEILVAHLRTNGWLVDPRSRAGNLISKDEKEKITFKSTVMQRWVGGRGRWRKVTSTSKIALAQGLVVAARSRVEGTPVAHKRLRAATKKKRTRKTRAKSKAEQAKLALRLAVVEISLELSPSERAAVLSKDSVREAYYDLVLGRASTAQVHSSATVKSIDSMLSVGSPPIPLAKGRYGVGDTKATYTGEHAWVDKGLKRPVRVWAHSDRMVGIEFGSMPVNPITQSIDLGRSAESLFSDAGPRGDGFTASLRGKGGALTAYLFMIATSKTRSGAGTKYLRLWCKLLKAYGASPLWVAEAVGDQGLAFISKLQDRGELEIVRNNGSYFLVRCHRLGSDERQGWLFAPAKVRAQKNPLHEMSEDSARAVSAAARGRSVFSLKKAEAIARLYFVSGGWTPHPRSDRSFTSPDGTIKVRFVAHAVTFGDTRDRSRLDSVEYQQFASDLASRAMSMGYGKPTAGVTFGPMERDAPGEASAAILYGGSDAGEIVVDYANFGGLNAVDYRVIGYTAEVYFPGLEGSVELVENVKGVDTGGHRSFSPGTPGAPGEARKALSKLKKRVRDMLDPKFHRLKKGVHGPMRLKPRKNPSLAKLPVKGNAASELDIQLEVVLEDGEQPGEGAYWPLLAQWTGKHVVVFDKAHALRLADIADSMANALDTGLEDNYIRGEERHASRGAMRGLTGLSGRLRRIGSS